MTKLSGVFIGLGCVSLVSIILVLAGPPSFNDKIFAILFFWLFLGIGYCAGRADGTR